MSISYRQQFNTKQYSPGAPNNPVAAGAGAPKMEVPGAGVGAALPIAKETTTHHL